MQRESDLDVSIVILSTVYFALSLDSQPEGRRGVWMSGSAVAPDGVAGQPLSNLGRALGWPERLRGWLISHEKTLCA